MRNRILLTIIIVLTFYSCGIFKTHHKDKLIDFENNSINNQSLKLNGYYYTEFEFEFGENSPPFIDDYIRKTGIKKIKYLSVFFIYEDGFIIKVGGINGLSHFYCAEKDTYENTYESAHKTIELMLKSQNSSERRTKRICGFSPKDIGDKGLAEIDNNNIKVQFYSIEMQNPTKDSFNSAYLYELNGTIKSDTSFVIKSEMEFRTNKKRTENKIFKFRQTDQKPNIENYFKSNINRFN
ncbi:hypothetical protein [Psychroserpens mesophilus]|uniref:hypothetical protein n=1 Tax=Psychroserpens mesophilus TaxID=325473 RepID=UPI00058ECD67|nr:hypothetical protein [Psychroserpens mesophilus]